MINITAVARKARVSTATVSRTINGSPNVSPRTAARVHRAIEALGFYPNINARALGSGRSSLYGLIISDITNPFFPELVKAFEDIAVQHKKEILIANTNYDSNRMESCVTRMLQRKVDGVAIMTSETDERLTELFSRRKIPLVFLDTRIKGPGMSSVNVDYHRGILDSMEHLVGLGHRRIACIRGPLALSSARIRFAAYEEAVQRHGLHADPGLVGQGDHRVDGGFLGMQQIFNSGTNPTAIVCSNDLTAIGAVQAIYERGFRVPQDISVVGFDNIQLSAYTHPGLTTIGIERTELANLAFVSLLNLCESVGGKPSGEEYVVTPRLIVRGTTAPPPR